MPRLIVFLGNPGIQYSRTRHNTGWMVCNEMERTMGLTSWQTKFHAQYSKMGDAVLLKPQTFMNGSGISVQEAAKFFNIQCNDILVVHDDIELPFSNVKLQLGGGMGGHNGLKSVRQHLGTDKFARLRVGIGRPPATIQVANYLLGRFSPVEEKQMEDVVRKAAEFGLNFAKSLIQAE